MHTDVYIQIYSAEFSTAHEYISLGLPTWDWITYQGAHPWRRLILPVSASIIAYDFSSRSRAL